jgi:hypothetical protein
VTETKNCGSKGYRTSEDMIFLVFSVDLGMKAVNKLKDTEVYLTGNLTLIPVDGRMSPDLLRGTE